MGEGVAGVVLAAGAGRRFGMPKALVEHRGELFVDRAARVLAEGGCAPVVVVLGAAADTVRERADLTGVTVVFNPDWSTGMGSSLRVALDALARTTSADTVSAALITPVDMPGIGPSAVRRVAAHASHARLAAATHQGRRSHPVLIGRDHWSGASESAVGDSGARQYLRDHEVTLVTCDDVSEGFDIDRPEDLDRP
ncbi:nucleotidyltransferase family protein [Saccharopolyspora erythraea]|uniref:nucleotidyltransferase family protein n=1 Tax=Saccharopolyspora erythraea TaxID=1836 RepID=UPI001BA4B380|nr:nucleotidyltransferase family protein [Saccharopolyspora erythraea]QUH00469.1 nucleotidyltransferase family protein [Saccharopolyspora erythraea]